MLLNRVALVSLLVGVIFLVGCISAKPESFVPQSYDLYRMSKNSVDVVVTLERNEAGGIELVAVFTPEEPSLHLYATDFPRSGIEGVGRPTLLEIVSGPVQATDVLQANVQPETHLIQGFDTPFNLFPDGPVVLTQPINLLDTPLDSTTLKLSITYMACSSDGGCKPPVTNHQFEVLLPDLLWSNEDGAS